MDIKHTIVVPIMCVVMLTAIGNGPATAISAPAKEMLMQDGPAAPADPIVQFQQEVIPTLEATIEKYFPRNGTVALIDQADYYFDNSDLNNLKVVFLVDKNSKEMKALRQELEETIGDKVIFKKAKVNPRVLADTAWEVAEYVDQYDHESRGYSVGVDSEDEVIHIQAKLTDEQMDDLNNTFGAGLLKITNETRNITTSLLKK